MPLYEYVCRKCDHPFEELVFGSAAARCPKCGAADVERVLSVISVGRGRERAPEAPRGCGGCQEAGSCGAFKN